MSVKLPSIDVIFPARLAKRFKDAAKKAFREGDGQEEYAILLAEVEPDGTYRVEDLYFPEDRLKESTNRGITIKESWFWEAEKIADVEDLVVIGDMHSHCYNHAKEPESDTAPSEQDWDYVLAAKKYFNPQYSVLGICRVVEKKGKYRANLKFWSAPVEIKTKISKT